MTKNLIIIFVKNIILGKVKTRLAKTIGDKGAFDIYYQLVKITEEQTQKIKTDKRIYFSDVIINSKWEKDEKFVQQGDNLGERMKNAFKKGFEDGYERIVLIGSDLPDITSKIITKGLDKLNESDTVFGPAIDGGYYLIGMRKLHDFIFENKPWSQPQLLKETLQELQQKNITYTLLESLNDIDTFEDLKASKFYKTNKKIQQIIQSTHD